MKIISLLGECRRNLLGRSKQKPSTQKTSTTESVAKIQFVRNKAQQIFGPVVVALNTGASPDSGNRSYRLSVDHVRDNLFHPFREKDRIRIVIGHFNDQEAETCRFFTSITAAVRLPYHGLEPADISKRSVTISIPVHHVSDNEFIFHVIDDPELASRLYKNVPEVIHVVRERFAALAKADAMLAPTGSNISSSKERPAAPENKPQGEPTPR